jgi:hypothetical protein
MNANGLADSSPGRPSIPQAADLLGVAPRPVRNLAASLPIELPKVPFVFREMDEHVVERP